VSGYKAKRIDEMQASAGGGFVKARAELGLTAFGAQVIRMGPDETRYPEHDHSHDGQEELYAVLSGDGRIEIDGESIPLDPGVLVGVAPQTKRKVYSGPSGIELLVVGGVAGEAYKPAPFSELE
jgi:mannose-6-phosphate isomerase-like protein (cupin superfamily)